MIQKHVLVTGADGFIGSHLTRMLCERGYSVRALCQYNSFGSWGWLDNYRHDNLEIVMGDVRDSAFCRQIGRGIDVIYHLAALIAIPYSYFAPQSYIDTNVTGTLNMLQSAVDNHVGRIVVTSTSEVYGTAVEVPISESHPRQPQSPYSASKIAADAVALSFYHAYSLPVTVARPFNTYGPCQSARAVIPSIISQIAAGKRVIEVGDLTPTRDFNYVTDTCRGFIALAESDDTIGREINIATGTEVSMGDTFKLIASLMEADVEFVVDPARLRPATSEVFRLCGDNRLIKSLTQWHPEVTFEQGLKRTIEWFTDKDNLSRYKTDVYVR